MIRKSIVVQIHAGGAGGSATLTMAHCVDAYYASQAAAISKGQSKYQAERAAIMAYRLAMPPLDSVDQIKCYISCLVQGITYEVFDSRETGQLLYAAQVALSIERVQPKTKTRKVQPNDKDRTGQKSGSCS